MEFRASHRYARISSRKVRDVLRLIQGVRADQALALLGGSQNQRSGPVKTRAASFVSKVLESAIANARDHGDVDGDDVFVTEVRAEDAPTKHLQRLRARARGMGYTVRRGASHIHVVLATYE